jgi:hypothetical protein
VLRAAYRSEAAARYQRRVRKHRERLFTFLDHDGVPWNNNNAENALKRFAARRRVRWASSTERGLKDYLLFLSLAQTLRHKGVNFLRFLASGEQDLDAFVARGGR